MQQMTNKFQIKKDKSKTFPESQLFSLFEFWSFGLGIYLLFIVCFLLFLAFPG
jgi:hypothetical protein